MHMKLEAYTKIFYLVNPNEPTVYKQGNMYAYISLDTASSYYWKFGRNGVVWLSLWVFYFQNLFDIKEFVCFITKFDYLRANFFFFPYNVVVFFFFVYYICIYLAIINVPEYFVFL